MPSNHLLLCYPLLLLTSTFSSIRVFFNELDFCIRQSKYWNFSISPSNEYSELISFRIDWFDLLSVRGLSRVFSSATIWKHQFLPLSLLYGPTLNPYMATGKTIALIILILFGKLISLLFNMLQRFIIAFLPRSKHLLISWWFWSPRK